jgi:peroxiredoxin
VVAVRDHLDRFADAVIAVVTFADVSRLADYRRHLDLPFRVLTDPDREVYRAFGLRRGRWWTVYGWSTWRRYAELMGRGRRLRRPTEDTLQLGGDFVVDRQGRLAYGFWGDEPAARPPLTELWQALDGH